MIPIREFDTIIQQMLSTESLAQVDHYHLVADDAQAQKKIGSKPGTHLVAVIPSADKSGSPGRTVDDHTTLLFVVRKPKASIGDDGELTIYAETQDLILKISQYILSQQEDGCSAFFRLDVSSISIDPAYNVFGGHNGWSMSFVF